MAGANGYILNVSSSRREILLDEHTEGGLVAQSVPEFNHPRNQPLVCFAGFADNAITHLAIARKGFQSESRSRRLNLENLTELSAPISHESVMARVPGRFRNHVGERLRNGGLLPPGSFGAVVEALRELSPSSRILLDRFSERRSLLIRDLSTEVRESLAYQKETVATALTLAGLPRTNLQAWQPDRVAVSQTASFLDGLPQVRLREDPMIISDLLNFPGFDLIRTGPHASAVFSTDSVTLTVVMANRQPLEQQTGADLIYCNDTFGAFVMVQYKAMEHESGSAVFRLPSAQLADELSRMDDLWKELQKCVPDASANGFRFSENPFFLKLCPRIQFDPDDLGLVKGMYVPVDFWRRLESDDRTLGPKGGRLITFGNVGRRLDNTSFAALVAGGWIGTTLNQSAVLRQIIRQCLETGHTVTLAIKTTQDASTGTSPDGLEVAEDE